MEEVVISILTKVGIFLFEYGAEKGLDKGLKITAKKKTLEKQLIEALEQALQMFCIQLGWEYDESAIKETFCINLQTRDFEWTNESLRSVLSKAVGAEQNGIEIDSEMLNCWCNCFLRALVEESREELRNYLAEKDIQIFREYLVSIAQTTKNTEELLRYLVNLLTSEAKLNAEDKLDAFLTALVKYQQGLIFNRHTSTAMGLSLRDIFSSKYYVEPPHKVESGMLESKYTTLSEEIQDVICQGESILVYGEAGYGKTTVLAKCFLDHANKYLNGDISKVPLFLALRQKGKEYHFSLEAYLKEEWESLTNGKPFPNIDIKRISPIFYCDGFDEIAEQMSLDHLNRIKNSDIFRYPILLTCRYQYAIRYINSCSFSDKFGIRVQMDKWNAETTRRYIEGFCKIKNYSSDISQKLVRLSVESSNEITNVLDSPLLITMFLWFVEQNRMQVSPEALSLSELFRNWINELARRECEKLESKDNLVQTIIDVWVYSAWILYLYKVQGKNKISFDDLLEELSQRFPPIDGKISFSWFEVMFDSNKEYIFDTFHEQFLEYMVAKLIIDACVRKEYPYPDFLKIVMRPEINRYIRTIWRECRRDDQEKIVAAIYEQYKMNLSDDAFENVFARVNAVYHIGRMQVPKQNEYLEYAFKHEKHISVLLSLYFGKIKMGDLECEEEFYNKLNDDEGAYNEANRGYHLAYYSDTLPGDELPFRDDISRGWEGTLKAFERHFNSENIGHYYLRRIDLVTMRRLIQVRGYVRPLDKEVMEELKSKIRDAQFNRRYPEYARKIEEEYNRLLYVFDELGKSM